MGYKRNPGFTVIELLVVMVIITVLGTSGAFIMRYFVQSGIYIPNELNVDMLASDAIDIMTDGDDRAKGLRFSRSISVSNGNRVRFINQDGQDVRYMLIGTQLFRRIIGAGPRHLVPYYQATGMGISGVSNRMFTYYDAAGAVTTDPALVRRVAINLIAGTGAGSFDQWDGLTQQSSSVKVNRYQ